MKNVLVPELVSETENFVRVAGRNWTSANVQRCACVEGKTIKEILVDALCRHIKLTTGEDRTPSDIQIGVWLDRCRCKVDNEEISSTEWGTFIPKAGSFVEFLVTPGKGGGGKNVLSTILMVAVIAVAAVTQQWYLTSYGTATMGAAAGGSLAGTTVTGAVASTYVGMGVATWTTASSLMGYAVFAGTAMAGSMLVNAICPTIASPQSNHASSASASSNTYAINGSRNAANPYGYIPLVLGKFRFAGPLGAKSWTKQIGDDQYFHMLVVWGHPDMSVTDFRIGKTPLSEFKDVDHVFHGATTGDDLKYFGKSYSETSVGAGLLYDKPIVRNVGECDSISVDIYFPALANVSTGKTEGTSVNFKIEYAPEGTEDWKTYAHSTKFFAPAQYRDGYTGADEEDAWASSDGTWHVRYSDSDWDNPNFTSGKIRVTDPHWNPYPVKRYKDKHKHHEWWFRDAWYDAGESEIVSIGASSTSPVTRSFEWAVPHGDYKVRITRVSVDQDKDTIYDDATWSIVRAIINKPAFNTPIPICVSELKIRATEQLSGYVDDFTALCTSRFPVYGKSYDENGNVVKDFYGWATDEDGEYYVDETQNPADHLRYLLTSRQALAVPYTSQKIDETSLANFAEWCIEKDYHFDYVCDTEVSAWSRLMSAASAGRANITTDNDGLFGVMVDNADKVVAQMFTPRNSWGFTIERSFYTLPHALRVAWYDETDEYANKEGFIYADGYNKSNATNIVEWSVTGKTRWEEVYKMGRYFLASTKLRPVTVTLSTDWEWLMCRRGDVVGVAHDVLMNTFGTARVVALIYRGSDGLVYYVSHEADKPNDGSLPIGVRLDDTVVFSENAAFGIAIRNANGNVLTYRVNSPYGVETADMIFSNGITEAQCPYIGALASVAIFGQEFEKYLVVSINVSNDNSAELALAPWSMPEIIDAESEEIPDWVSPIMLPTIGSKGELPAPSIREIKSDESMLKWTSGGTYISCMGVWYTLPSGIDADLGRITVQGQIIDDNGKTSYATADPSIGESLLFENIEDGVTYTVKIRLISEMGVTSGWSSALEHIAIGKTTRPDDVVNFKLTNADSKGIMLSWDENKEKDIEKYKITGDYPTMYSTYSPIYITPYNRIGIVTEYIQAVDTTGLESKNPAKAEFSILPPATPNIQQCRLLDNGINVSFTNAKTTWPLDYYQIDCNSAISLVKSVNNVIPLPTTWSLNGTLTIRAKDVFNNWGEATEDTLITWFPPKTPNVKLGYNKLTGNVTLEWQDCTNAVEGAPKIDRYEITGTLAQGGITSVKGTYYESVIPLTTYERGTEEEGGIEINVGTLSVTVTAIDKYGVSSKDAPNYVDNTVQLKIYPPYNPTGFGVTAELTDKDLKANWTEGGAIVLNWKDCQRTFAIDYYTIYDSYTKTSYKVSTNYVVLQARPEGSYPITVTAYDILGQTSATMTYNLIIGGVDDLTVSVELDGADVLLSWDTPSAAFNIDHYVIMEDNDIAPSGTNEDSALEGFLGTAKTNYFRVPAGKAGSYTYYVWAVDIAGNVNIGSSYASVIIEEPSAPSVVVNLAGEGVELKWASTSGENTLPVVTWDVRRYSGKVTSSTINNLTPVSDYGRLDVDTTNVPAFTIGTYTFAVRGIDSGGNEGAWGFVNFTAKAPGKITFTEPVLIDNNVQLYWTVPNVIFFPIKEYLFEEVEQHEDGTEYYMEIGTVDALFASETENVAGTYTYSIRPIDTGGNLGERAIITCRVAQPPDFMFYDKKVSTFNGEKSNMVLDGRGSMLAPVPVGETWEQNIARIKTLTNNTISSHQEKIDLGYRTWLEPTTIQGRYVEVIDHGTLVPNSNLTVTLTRQTLSGNPVITCMIEVSQDGDVWELISDNAFQVYASSFRYSRITLTVAGGYVKMSDMVVDLNIKKLTEYGRTTCYATDNGEGYENNPMLTGTFIPFTVGFTAVQSLPKPNVIGNGEYEAFTVFDGSADNLNPEGFRVYVLDKNGERVTAEVDWVAYGV